MRGTSVLHRDAQDGPERGIEITPTAIGGALAGGTLAGLVIEPLGWAVLAAGAGFVVGGLLASGTICPGETGTAVRRLS